MAIEGVAVRMQDRVGRVSTFQRSHRVECCGETVEVGDDDVVQCLAARGRGDAGRDGGARVVALGRVAGQRSTKTFLQGRYRENAMDEQLGRSAGEEAGRRL